MTAAPIAQCVVCSKFLYSPDEFLILVPGGIRGDVEIGGFDGFCERCYCAMGVSGGRQRWLKAMAPFTGRWVNVAGGESGMPWSTDGQTWVDGSNPRFPDNVSLTYFDRAKIDLFIFNKNGRCVVCTLPPDLQNSPRKNQKS